MIMKAFLTLLSMVIFIASCSDFLEEDISDDPVQLITPLNGFTSIENSINFVWEEIEGATDYQIQIVTPSFDSIVSFVARTYLGEQIQFDTSLLIGKYEWKIIASNSGYETESTVYNFEIMEDTVGSLINKSIQLITPSDNLITNDPTIEFLWGTLLNATSYSIQVANPDFSNSTFIFVDEETAEDNFSATLSEGNYRWRVRGENDISVSPYIERVLTIDLTPPTAPTLVTPLQGDTVTLPTTLAWEFDPSSTMDTLYVYSDSLVSAPLIQIPTTDSDFDFDDPSFSHYFWRVRSVDAAGNVSDYSTLQKFYIQ